MKLPGISPIIVIGMHRSGTTLVAKLLNELGVFMGRELDFYYEAKCFQNINKKLLAAQGAHWAKPQPFIDAIKNESVSKAGKSIMKDLLETYSESYGKSKDSGIWGWKDPRNTLTLPLWLQIFPDAKFIHIVRNGLNVAVSLYQRDILYWIKKSTEKRLFPPTIPTSFRLWEIYVRQGLKHERKNSKILRIHYENLLSNPEKYVRIIAEFSGIKIDTGKTKKIIQKLFKPPKNRGWWENTHIKILLRMGLLNPDLMKEMGYELKLH